MTMPAEVYMLLHLSRLMANLGFTYDVGIKDTSKYEEPVFHGNVE